MLLRHPAQRCHPDRRRGSRTGRRAVCHAGRLLDKCAAAWWSIGQLKPDEVGCGDIIPLTDTGRIVAAVLVFFGIGVFGYVAGFMSSLMEDPDEDEIPSAVKRIEQQLAALSERRGFGVAEPRPRQVKTGRFQLVDSIALLSASTRRGPFSGVEDTPAGLYYDDASVGLRSDCSRLPSLWRKR